MILQVSTIGKQEQRYDSRCSVLQLFSLLIGANESIILHFMPRDNALLCCFYLYLCLYLRKHIYEKEIVY